MLKSSIQFSTRTEPFRSLQAVMFQRAASSVVTQKQNSQQNQPYKLSQTKLPNLPLSPKNSSSINARDCSQIDKHGKHDICSTGRNLLDVINDNAPEKFKNPLRGANVALDAVYFNEDDFDDDMNLDFNSAPNTVEGQKKDVLSPAMSWPPSSYPVRSSPTTHRADPAVKTKDTFILVSPDHKIDVLATRILPSQDSPAAKKPRLLPWNKPSTQMSVTLGPKISQVRNASSSALSSASDECDPFQAPSNNQVTQKPDPHEITQSAVKLAIKRGRKRNSDDMNPPKLQLQLTAQRATGDVAKVFLSAEQRGVIDLIKTGKSVFFTGSAGTGKSVLLRTAIQELRLKHKNMEKVAVTASTGLAACNIGGITLHSFAGVGLGRDSVAEMVKKVKKVKKNVLKWTKTKVLIIDEISMVDAEFYDKLEAVARKMRANEKPWGGIQIVATGDFFQLPPVPDQGKVAKFAFEAVKWKSLDATIQLTTVFRQKDGDFIEMLNQMRTGSLTQKAIENFRLLQRPMKHDDGIIPTELFPTRYEVDNANAMRMRSLPGLVRSFDAEDTGSVDAHSRIKMLSNCMAPARLDLKLGAQVMLIKNRDDGLVNGSLGVVVGFMNERTYTYATDGGDEPLDETFLKDSPWTLEEFDAMDKSPAGKRKLLKVQQMSNSAGSDKVWPVVRFRSPNGGQDITQLMSPESWKFEQPNGEVQACRRQVPLILAYAISIHKAQGQTIERVKVDLGKVFEKGQAYVALSRAVSKEGLQILRFDAKKVMAHPKVAAFYRELDDAADAIEKYSYMTHEKSPEPEDNITWPPSMTTQEVFSQIKRDPMKAYAVSNKVRLGKS